MPTPWQQPKKTSPARNYEATWPNQQLRFLSSARRDGSRQPCHSEGHSLPARGLANNDQWTRSGTGMRRTSALWPESCRVISARSLLERMPPSSASRDRPGLLPLLRPPASRPPGHSQKLNPSFHHVWLDVSFKTTHSFKKQKILTHTEN